MVPAAGLEPASAFAKGLKSSVSANSTMRAMTNEMVQRAGVEPATPGSSNRCSTKAELSLRNWYPGPDLNRHAIGTRS